MDGHGRGRGRLCQHLEPALQRADGSMAIAARGSAVRPGDTVVVVGIGGVGINAVQGAKAAGARYVIAVDPVKFKRDMAEKLGATHTFDSMEAAIPAVGELTWGVNANTVILTVGEIKGEHIAPAMAMVAKGGQTIVVGMGDFQAMDVQLNLFEMTLLQKKLQGAIFGGAGPRTQVPKLLNEYRAGLLNLADLVTQTYRLEDINRAYDDMLEGNNIRGMIVYDETDW